jgi:hypothetical protein
MLALFMTKELEHVGEKGKDNGWIFFLGCQDTSKLSRCDAPDPHLPASSKTNPTVRAYYGRLFDAEILGPPSFLGRELYNTLAYLLRYD